MLLREYRLNPHGSHRQCEHLRVKTMQLPKTVENEPRAKNLAFELHIERALYSRYKPRGEPDAFPPEYLKWKLETASSA